MLRALDVDVTALRDALPPSTDDVAMLEFLQGSDFVFVSADRRIRKVTVEVAALKAARITNLFFRPFWANMKLWDQALWLVKNWPKIDAFTEVVTKGTSGEMKQNGKVDTHQV